jgi:hypothetical protein
MGTAVITPTPTELQVIAVQNPAGRRHEHVRVFGYKVDDLAHRVREVAVSTADAADLIAIVAAEKAFPIIEVEDRYVVICLNTGDIEMIHLKEQP